MNINIFLLIMIVVSLAARAEPAAPDPSASPTPTPSSVGGQPTTQASKFDPGLLGGNNPVLTDQEKAGVAITQAWRDKSYETMVGQPGANSSVQFRFGESLPSIVCAILQVTDIELQPGEVVTYINLGDSTRWSVESALSGSSSDQVEHLIVKPARHRAFDVARRYDGPAHVSHVAGERRSRLHALRDFFVRRRWARSCARDCERHARAEPVYQRCAEASKPRRWQTNTPC